MIKYVTGLCVDSMKYNVKKNGSCTNPIMWLIKKTLRLYEIKQVNPDRTIHANKTDIILRNKKTKELC